MKCLLEVYRQSAMATPAGTAERRRCAYDVELLPEVVPFVQNRCHLLDQLSLLLRRLVVRPDKHIHINQYNTIFIYFGRCWRGYTYIYKIRAYIMNYIIHTCMHTCIYANKRIQNSIQYIFKCIRI